MHVGDAKAPRFLTSAHASAAVAAKEAKPCKIIKNATRTTCRRRQTASFCFMTFEEVILAGVIRSGGDGRYHLPVRLAHVSQSATEILARKRLVNVTQFLM